MDFKDIIPTAELALQESEHRFRSIVESSREAIFVHYSGLLAYANPACLQLMRASIEQMMGMDVLHIAAPEYRDLVSQRIQKVREGDHKLAVAEMEFVRFDGTRVDVEVSSSGTVYNGHFSTLVVARDITARKQAENALRISENKLRSLFAAITDVILVLDKDGRYIEIAATNSDLLYRPSDQLLGMTLHDVFPPEQADYFLRHIKSTLASNEPVEIRYTLDISGKQIWFAAKLSKLNEDSIVLVARDITESKQAEEKIRYLGQHDILTGLPNRALFEDRLAQTIALAETHEAIFALLFLDVDHFKKINDSFGHQHGDLFLKEVARRLTASVKSIDTVSRQGGDEFIILLHELANPEEAALIAHKICDALAEPFRLEQAVMQASISIGVAVYPRDGVTQEMLLKNSDIAMYHAKERGRNQFQYFSQELNRVTHERLEMETALRQAIANGQVEVHYQPQLNFRSGKIESCEALLRWNHPAWGAVSPARFIPIAEESGQIPEIGAWVMTEVARRFRELKEAGFAALRISVNVSAAQIQHPQFCEVVEAIIGQNGILPDQLELEVTESILMQDTQRSVATMHRLSGLGVKFSIDDFGTGYSSLSYLRQLKIDYLKIDQSFVRDIMDDADDAAIVRTIIGLAHNLRLQVVAEGVETREQQDFLRSHGCDTMQGFLFARPMPFAELLQFLQR
jgi:diguanylate cyclase (GGDEF)-like protein/PAS domain S-box-containing protein